MGSQSQTRVSDFHFRYFHFPGDQGPGVRRSEAEPFSKAQRTCSFRHLVVNRSVILQTPSMDHNLVMVNGRTDVWATWCEEPAHWERPWCWERLRARGEGGDGGWDGWMTSSTQWTWVWANSGRWWRTGKPGVLQSMGSQSQTWLSDWTTTSKSGWVGWQREGGAGFAIRTVPWFSEREREKGTEAGWWPGFLQGETDYITAYVFLELKKKGASLPTWEGCQKSQNICQSRVECFSSFPLCTSFFYGLTISENLSFRRVFRDN